MKKILIISVAIFLSLALAACQSGGGNPTVIIPSPVSGQWVSYGGGNPPIAGQMFSFPSASSGQYMGYVYTQLSQAPKPGQTLTLNYSLIANNPIWIQDPANSPPDTNPPTISLFLWQRGDNLSCAGGLAQYRLWAAKATLVPGSNQTLSAVLDPSVWTGCYAGHSTAAQFANMLNNLVGVGFSIGGQNFDGHGVANAGGTALFYMNGLRVN